MTGSSCILMQDWVADGNVMSPSRKAREDSDSCAPLREQLAARENQVNELLREKTKAQVRRHCALGTARLVQVSLQAAEHGETWLQRSWTWWISAY